MSEQRHIIKRQVIELKVRGSVEARLYQDEASRIYCQRVIPLIDQRCSEVGRPDQLYRIQTLDLDLGVLDLKNLEEDLVAKVDAALRRELLRQIDACEETVSGDANSSKMQSQLELFAFFIRTGNLPWWADPSHPGLLTENLERLLSKPSDVLVRLLTELVRDPQPRQRMISHYTDEQLAALCGLLVPVYGEAFKRDGCELLSALQNVQAMVSNTPARVRQSLWNHFLLVTGMGGQQYGTLHGLYQAALKRVAADLGTTGSNLVAGLYQVIQDRRISVNSDLADVITRLTDANVQELIFLDEFLVRRMTQSQAGGLSHEAWRKLRDSLPCLSIALRLKLADLLNQLPASESRQTIALRVLHLLELETASQNIPVSESDASSRVIPTQIGSDPEILKVMQMFRTMAQDSNVSDPIEPETTASVQGKILSEQVGQALPGKEKIVDLRFSETEELLIGNAGLVILWPFLKHFLCRLSLLDKDHHFRDSGSRHRAAGLLQMVASQEASPPEYLLPLNKLLCGMELSEVFDFGTPLLDVEVEECTELLKAVIAQAPILNDMSVDSFRNTFLLRPGLLSTQEGMWLLRVERQTYDIVLERFPWTWEWVKLPWMEAPLRVEW